MWMRHICQDATHAPGHPGMKKPLPSQQGLFCRGKQKGRRGGGTQTGAAPPKMWISHPDTPAGKRRETVPAQETGLKADPDAGCGPDSSPTVCGLGPHREVGAGPGYSTTLGVPETGRLPVRMKLSTRPKTSSLPQNCPRAMEARNSGRRASKRRSRSGSRVSISACMP